MKSPQKTALITGSNGLIGTELCRRFLAEGYLVYGLDKKAGELKDPNYTVIKCDLAKVSSVKAALNKIKSLNTVINNAAATDVTFKNFDSVTLKEWERGLAVNLTSCFVIAQLARVRLEKSQGAIINISSTRAEMSEPNTVIYSASKGGVIALTHSLAITLGPKIRVNAISPGWIASPDESIKKQDHSQHPVGRVGMPSDIAELALYLSSTKASFITGQNFTVDGGMTKKMIYV